MKKIKRTTFLVAFATLSLCGGTTLAQSVLNADGDWHQISYSGTYEDLVMPTSLAYPFIELRLVGADGGLAKAYGCDRVVGGAGSIVTALFQIGDADGRIPPAATLRFIVGGAGQAVSGKVGAGGGGGGSAVLLQLSGDSNPFRILAVAGGGGGGMATKNGFGFCFHDPGNNATTGTSGGSADGNGDGKGVPGSNGEGAKQTTDNRDFGGGGGGAYSDAYYSNRGTLSQSGKKGAWEGGDGGWYLQMSGCSTRWYLRGHECADLGLQRQPAAAIPPQNGTLFWRYHAACG